MEELSKEEWFGFFISFAFPGFTSMVLYRFIIPANKIDWAISGGESIFYGLINLTLSYSLFSVFAALKIVGEAPWPPYRLLNALPDLHFYLYFVITPILSPIIFIKMLRVPWVQRSINLPYHSAWDFCFLKRRSHYILVRLKNDKLIGGYYGEDSYATSFPFHGDLFLEKVVEIKDDGSFGDLIEDSEGLIIQKSEYSYIELFSVSEKDENKYDQSTEQQKERVCTKRIKGRRKERHPSSS